MRATGIVRRMDDLGRVVIPKEIRRAMKIEVGQPLEIYTEDGCVCFKPYIPYGQQDWEKVFRAVQPIISCPFVIMDNYGGVQASSHRLRGEVDGRIEIREDGDTIGYIGFCESQSSEKVIAELNLAVRVAEAILSEG
jgi:AbrB family looped-hinge helix DNA binding protein